MRIVYSTFPNREAAVEIGEKLLKERLIACYNTFEITSGYWWNGKIEKDSEWGCIFKTDEEHIDELFVKLVELHPYDIPAVFSIPVEKVYTPYEKWLKEQMK